MLQHRMPQPCGKAHRRHSGKILRRHRAGKPHDAQSDHDGAHFHNVAPVAAADALIHDTGHNQRHQQLKRGLQQLEQRPKDTFFFIALQIFEKFFHTLTS